MRDERWKVFGKYIGVAAPRAGCAGAGPGSALLSAALRHIRNHNSDSLSHKPINKRSSFLRKKVMELKISSYFSSGYRIWNIHLIFLNKILESTQKKWKCWMRIDQKQRHLPRFAYHEHNLDVILSIKLQLLEVNHQIRMNLFYLFIWS